MRSRTAGLLSTVSIAGGLLLHTSFAAIGVTAAVVAVPQMLEVLQVVGPLLLIVMGIGALRSAPEDREREADQGAASQLPGWAVGLLVNLTNPKTWIAFLTVFPVLLHPDESGSMTRPMLLTGATLAVMAGVWFAMVALTVSRGIVKTCGSVSSTGCSR